MATGLSGLADSIALQGERANAFEGSAKRVDAMFDKRNEQMMLEQKRKLAEQAKEKELRDAMQEKLHSNIVKVSNVEGLLPKDVDEVQKDAMDFYTDANLHQYKTGKDWTTDPKLLEKYQGLQKKISFAKQDKQGLDQFGNFHAKNQDAYDLDKEGLMGYASKGIGERMQENPMTDPSYYQGRFQKPKSLPVDEAIAKGGLKDIYETLVPKSQITLANGNIVEVNDPSKYKDRFEALAKDKLDEVYKGEAPASMTGLYSTMWKKVNIEHPDEPLNIKQGLVDDLFVTKVAENQYDKAVAKFNSQLKTTTFKQPSKTNIYNSNAGQPLNTQDGSQPNGQTLLFPVGMPKEEKDKYEEMKKSSDPKVQESIKKFESAKGVIFLPIQTPSELGQRKFMYNKQPMTYLQMGVDTRNNKPFMKVAIEENDRNGDKIIEEKVLSYTPDLENQFINAANPNAKESQAWKGFYNQLSKKQVSSQGKKEGVKAPKKEYKKTDVTETFVKRLKDNEIVIIDGVERIKQDGKLKKVKR